MIRLYRERSAWALVYTAVRLYSTTLLYKAPMDLILLCIGMTHLYGIPRPVHTQSHVGEAFQDPVVSREAGVQESKSIAYGSQTYIV
jgi:hypothetical protein